MEQYINNSFTNKYQYNFAQSSESSCDNYFNTDFSFDLEYDGCTSLDDYFNNQFDFERDGSTSLDQYFNNQFDFWHDSSSLDSFNKQYEFDIDSNQSQAVLDPDTNSTTNIPYKLFLYREKLHHKNSAHRLLYSKEQLTKELVYNSMDHITEYDMQELKNINQLKYHMDVIDQMQICRELEAHMDDMEEMKKFLELEAQLELIDF